MKASIATPMVDVIDPAGLVRSRAIENASGSVRLTLNGAENHRPNRLQRWGIAFTVP